MLPRRIARGQVLAFVIITLLFVVTAVAEIVGCYLPWLVFRQDKSLWLLLPAAISLAVFAWLLTLHPSAAGRTYAAYGGVYIAVALAWLRLVDGVALTKWDICGAAVALVGMAIIAMQPMNSD
jgi:small multidrug resistance family-3 protein